MSKLFDTMEMLERSMEQLKKTTKVDETNKLIKENTIYRIEILRLEKIINKLITIIWEKHQRY